VNIKAGMSESQLRTARTFVETVGNLSGTDGVTVFTTGVVEDGRAARSFLASLQPALGARLLEPESLAELTAFLRCVDVVFPARLHSAILAIKEGAAVVRPPGMQKVCDYLDSEVAKWDRWNGYAVTSNQGGSADLREAARAGFVACLLKSIERRGGSLAART